VFSVMIVSRVSSICKVEEAANNGATLTVDDNKPDLPEHLELVSSFFILFIYLICFFPHFSLIILSHLSRACLRKSFYD
jgi:hypothetical protein